MAKCLRAKINKCFVQQGKNEGELSPLFRYKEEVRDLYMRKRKRIPVGKHRN